MSKEKFAKGDWALGMDSDFTAHSDSCGWFGSTPIESKGVCVAVAVGDYEPGCDRQEMQANAHLIAAAPRMYRALKHLHDTMINSTPKIELRDGVVLSADLIGKLLAEARGEK